MEKLKLPIIKKDLAPPSALSMDEYLQFVIFYLRYISPSSRGEEVTRLSPVNVPFRL